MRISIIKMFHGSLFFAVSPEIVPAPESHRNVASLSSSQTPYHSFPCKHENLFHFVAPPLPKKQMLFVDPTVFAKSYHFRTVIQLSKHKRKNIPQGVTFKTPIFVGFFKTFLFSLKLHNKKAVT